nr:hypothetical protein B296_00041162 [Ipomoea trifida]
MDPFYKVATEKNERIQAVVFVDVVAIAAAAESIPAGKIVERKLLRRRRLRRRRSSHLAVKRHYIGVLALHIEHLGLSLGQLRLKHVHLLLELIDRAGAAVHRISQPRVRLVHHAAHGVRPLTLRTHFSAQRRRKILQAAQGLITTGNGVVGDAGEDDGETEREDGGELVVSLDSIVLSQA